MMLSRGCEYGLRASLYLVSLKEDGFVPIRRLSQELDIEFHFLTKLFQQLTEAGLVHSQRGPKGGVAFAKPADAVTPMDVVLAIDGPELFQECVLGLPGCGEQRPCPLHEKWAKERERITDMFEMTSLRDMADRMMKEGHRLRYGPLHD
ncbi:MAG: Rrf2 family transcriptional regulator [Rhodothermales bacterium]